MTEGRETGSGDGSNGDGAGDGLDAWIAANFPAQPPQPAEPPVSPPPNLENPPPQPPAPTVPFGERAPEPPPFPPMTEELGGIPPATEFPPPPTEAFADVPGPSGIDALFGESKFLEYEEGPAASENPFVRKPANAATPGEGEGRPRANNKKTQVVLLWVAGSLVAVLALVALFVVGTKLPVILGPAPGALVLPTVTPTPTPTEVPLGPVAPGEYLWGELLGGECLDPYDGPWEVRYTVVDCETPHPAQLATRGTFVPPEGTTGYPGVEELQSQVNLLCTAPTVVDYGKANAYTDIQFEASFALSEQEWFDGNQYYYCFLSRTDGGELTGTIAMPQVAPPPTEEPDPGEEPAP